MLGGNSPSAANPSILPRTLGLDVHALAGAVSRSEAATASLQGIGSAQRPSRVLHHTLRSRKNQLQRAPRCHSHMRALLAQPRLHVPEDHDTF